MPFVIVQSNRYNAVEQVRIRRKLSQLALRDVELHQVVDMDLACQHVSTQPLHAAGLQERY